MPKKRTRPTMTCTVCLKPANGDDGPVLCDLSNPVNTTRHDRCDAEYERRQKEQRTR